MKTKSKKPMDKNFTPILWNFQHYNNQQISQVHDLNSLLQPLDEFQNLLKIIEDNAPEATDEVIENILNRIC